VFKTQYQRGHYFDALTNIHQYLEDLDAKHDFLNKKNS